MERAELAVHRGDRCGVAAFTLDVARANEVNSRGVELAQLERGGRGGTVRGARAARVARVLRDGERRLRVSARLEQPTERVECVRAREQRAAQQRELRGRAATERLVEVLELRLA